VDRSDGNKVVIGVSLLLTIDFKGRVNDDDPVVGQDRMDGYESVPRRVVLDHVLLTATDRSSGGASNYHPDEKRLYRRHGRKDDENTHGYGSAAVFCALSTLFSRGPER
jgi:hypothetical protein